MTDLPFAITTSDSGVTRRGFLRTSGLLGAGAAVVAGLGTSDAVAAPLSAPGWRTDVQSMRFTVAVVPDTQYLFDGDSLHPEPLRASFRHILDRRDTDNIVFIAHLGDVTQNGTTTEMDSAATAFTDLDRAGAAYSVLAGNHDVDSSTDDQRGSTPYLTAFGPSRFRHSPSLRGSSPDGYNSYHVFRAAGRSWLLLSLDWRLSDAGFTWARGVLAANTSMPTILCSHELVQPGDRPDDQATLSDYGRRVYDGLIADSDQVFLTLNGHFWPPARTAVTNKSGHEVDLHLTNYQNRYYGGAAMIRLYHFDLDRHVIDVETINPFIAAQPADRRNELAAEEVELSGATDRFTVDLDPARRFAGLVGSVVRATRSVSQTVIGDTLAYWRFDSATDGTALAAGTRVSDRSGRGNDLVVTTTAGSAANDLTYSTAHHPDQPSHGSIRFAGNPKTGTLLTTVASAPINSELFTRGYTIEAFFVLRSDIDYAAAGFIGLVSRDGDAGTAGKAGPGQSGDPQEAIATLSLSGDRELQWCIYPTNSGSSITNWGHELPTDRWWHVAVVNDGRRSVMYVDGCPVVRNPVTPSTGIATVGKSWFVGGVDYAGKVDATFVGSVGDIRIVGRALRPDDFMIA